MTKEQRIALAFKALKGTAIGDAFGDSFFGETDAVLKHIQERTLPPTLWEFTDDTVMAIAIYDQLRLWDKIDQDELAKDFVRNHDKDVNRGYGATARRILREIGEGGDWKTIATGVFEGMGSMGNGASMRVCPIGAYFYDDLDKVKAEAIKSAEVTHANPEGITGAIAVAVATALATRCQVESSSIEPNDFIEEVVVELPDTDTRSKIKKGTTVPYTYHIETVRSILGNGSQIMAQDTVPFAIWCAAHNLNQFSEGLWKAVSILGDRDTIGAIVGGITIMASPTEYVPKEWVTAVEDVETSVFRR